MELAEFALQIPGFEGLQPRAQIRLFGWFLHVHRGSATFDNGAIRSCFRKIGLPTPNIAVYLPRMAARKPPDLIRQRDRYNLARPIRLTLDAKYGTSEKVVVVTRLLADLPAKVPDKAESVFLAEALGCYKAGAYRGATIMVWNLAFHHVQQWIMADPQRLIDFNHALPRKFPKHSTTITRIDDFEEIKEADVIDICRTGKLLSKATIEILWEKLKRRNLAAHPSLVIVSQSQADDTITDLVNNIVLALV